MKAAFAALLGAALVFTIVLVGLGTELPDISAPDSVELGRASSEIRPIQTTPRGDQDDNRRRDDRNRTRGSRNVEEVPAEVETVALADLDDDETGPLASGDGPPGDGPAGRDPGPRGDGPGDREGPRVNPSPPPSDNRVAVPNLIGMDKDRARDTLEGAGLEDGDISQRDSCADDDEVLSQSIAPGTRVRRGTTVNFTISTGEAPDEDNSGSGSNSSGPGSGSDSC